MLRTVNDHRARRVARLLDLRPPLEFCVAARIGVGCTGAAPKHPLRTRLGFLSTPA